MTQAIPFQMRPHEDGTAMRRPTVRFEPGMHVFLTTPIFCGGGVIVRHRGMGIFSVKRDDNGRSINAYVYQMKVIA